MVEDFFDFGNGVTITKATQDDFDELNANLRADDRAECNALGYEGEDPKWYQRAWAIRKESELIGIIGWAMFNDTTPLSKSRLFLLMTTNAVWKHKVEYVKMTPVVARKVVSMMPEWVTDVYALPMSAYKKSIKWQKRILGFREIGEIEVNGVMHTRLHAKRNEVMK